MSDVRRLFRHALHSAAGAAGTFVLWMLWLALGAVACVQIYVAVHNQLTVPDFVLRRLESRLRESGLTASFDRATFDPTGRVFVEGPRVYLPEFSDPIVTARAAYVGLNPWALVVGRVDPDDIRIVEGTILVPAVLSPSGKPEPIVEDVDARVSPGSRTIAVQHLTGRIGALHVSVQGGISRVPAGTAPGEPVPARLRAHFVEYCRGAVKFAQRLQAFEEPSIDLRLDPATSRGAIVSVDLIARGFQLDDPVKVQVTGLRARTEFPLVGDAPSVSRLELTAADVRLPRSTEVVRVRTVWVGRLKPADLRVEPVAVEVSADRVEAPEGAVDAVSGTARPVAGGRWTASAVGRVLGSELAVAGEVDPQTRSGSVEAQGVLTGNVLGLVNRQVGVDVTKYFRFETLDCATARATFGPGGKFQRLDARVALQRIDAYGVRMDEGRAVVELEPGRFYSPDAFARIGPNFARGSYEHHFGTREFRFLLDGRLRPMDISRWFHEWWPNFFEHFAFPSRPPDASVDVQGTWHQGRRTSVFVFADADRPVLYEQPLQRLRTRLFIRPGFYDTLELRATDPAGGEGDGTFTVATDLDSGDWRSVDFEGRSTLAFNVVAGIAGALKNTLLVPFEMPQAPTLTGHGHLDGPAIERNAHQVVDVSVRAPGAFRFEHLPFENVAFTTALRDDVLTVDVAQATFAGGAFRTHAKLWGPESQRRFGFDASLDNASFGVAVAALQAFAAERKQTPPPVPGKFVQEKANVRIDLAASADGLYGNLLSFHGSGNAALRGAEIGEVPLFGPLSALLKFTALRFTTAQSSFKINGPKLEFPDVAVRGSNSALDAHGEYLLDRRQLDFRVKVFPFQESDSVLKSVVGAVLSPISNALEVRLTGSLDKPEWAFVIGPTNLFRSHTPEASGPPGTTEAPPKPTGSTAPAAGEAAAVDAVPVPKPPGGAPATGAKPKVD